VLEHLGVSIAATGEQAAHALREAGICFLFAPAFHPATRHAQVVRRELKMRTAFNLLGPLSNPAATSAQIVGTPSLDAATRVASALAELGLKRGYVFHGDDGLDEVSLSGPTAAFEIRAGAVSRFTLTPEDFGMSRCGIKALRGGVLRRTRRSRSKSWKARVVRGAISWSPTPPSHCSLRRKPIR